MTIHQEIGISPDDRKEELIIMENRETLYDAMLETIDLGTLLDEPAQDTLSVSELELKAENDPEACYQLGLMYMNGTGVEQNLGKALSLFREAGDAVSLSCAAVICLKMGQFDLAEYLLHQALENSASNMHGQIKELLGLVYSKSGGENDGPAYQKAARCYEDAYTQNPENGGRIAPLVAKVYAAAGDLLKAIHWYKIAINDYNITDCEDDLWKLYLTGIAGSELKQKAELRFGIKPEKQPVGESKPEAAAQTAVSLQQHYPEEFAGKLKLLAELIRQYKWYHPGKEPQPIPEKKGFIFTNQREINRIKRENEENARDYQALGDRIRKLSDEVLEEKKKLGITGKLFFEYDLDVKIDTHRWSIFCPINGDVNKQEEFTGFYCYHYAIHAAGEMKMAYYDEAGTFVSPDRYEQGDYGTLRLYTDGFWGWHSIKQRFLREALESKDLFPLYYDEELLHSNPDEKVYRRYIWGIGRYITKGDELELGQDVSAEKLYEAYYRYNPSLTKLIDRDADDYVSRARKTRQIRELTTAILPEKTAAENLAVRDLKSVHAGQKLCLKKLAIAYYVGDQIALIVMCRQQPDELNVEFVFDAPEYPALRENPSGRRIYRIEQKRGEDWEDYVTMTMAGIARLFKKNLRPFDGTELKPDALSDELWGYWLRRRMY